MPLQVPDTEDAKTFHVFFSLTPGIVQLQPVVFLNKAFGTVHISI